MKVFVSYGHDEYVTIVKRIIEDLHKSSIDCWVDIVELRSGKDWENAIESGIEASDFFLLFMSNYSLRRPDGYCLSEISYSQYFSKPIIPIKIENVVPPISIIRLQYLDISPLFKHYSEELYQEKLQQIIDVCKGRINLSSQEENSAFLCENKILENLLHPLDNEKVLSRYNSKFYGRKQIIDSFASWINDPSSKVFALFGGPGTGKTALTCQLVNTCSNIKAVHFCEYNNSSRSDIKNILSSLSFHLASQIDEYRQLLKSSLQQENINEMSSKRLFEFLFIDLLSKLKTNPGITVIAIDALDEAITFNDKNEILSLISKEFSNTPSWLKLLITSRPERNIKSVLSKFSPLSLDSSNNGEDIYQMCLERLNTADAKEYMDIAKKISIKSEGNFLYASILLNKFIENNLDVASIEAYPPDLNAYYMEEMNKAHEHLSCYPKNDIKRFLRIIIASLEPIKLSKIEDILSYEDDDEFENIVDAFSQLFKKKEDYIKPIHKSLFDFLTDEENSGDYYISAKKAHNELASYYFNLYEKEKYPEYSKKHLIEHLLLAKRYDDALEVLTSLDFILKCDEILPTEEIINKYIDYAISITNNLDEEDSAESFLLGESFEYILDKYSSFVIRHGLLIKLKELNFDKYITKFIKRYNERAFLIVSYYYYLTEEFNISKQFMLENKLLEDFTSKDILEYLDLMTLIDRKLCNYDEYYTCSSKLLTEARKLNNAKYEYKALQKLGRYYFINLDFDKTREYYLDACDIIQKEIDKESSSFAKTQLMLHKGCYLHELALFCLYEKNISFAAKLIEDTKKVYELCNNQKDRFYGRWCYVNLFYNVLVDNELEVERYYNLAITNANNKVKLALTEYYVSFYYLKRANKQEAMMHITKAKEYSSSLETYMEKAEINALASYIETKNFIEDPIVEKNSYIKNFINYMEKFITNLMEK